MKEKSKDRVQWVYSSGSNEELSETYDEWAKDYDQDLSETFGWIAPKTASDYLAKYVPKHGLVLDAGAGTGLVGLSLAEHGYKNLIAMALSKEMLNKAREKGVYNKFDQMILGKSLNYETDFFDGVISVGVMTLGHAGPDSFDELVRITKPYGFIVFTIRTDVYLENGFKEKQEEMLSSKLWELMDVSDKFHPMPVGEPEVLHQVWVYRVLKT